MARIVGILLAAGQGARFGGDKLLAPFAPRSTALPRTRRSAPPRCAQPRDAMPETIAVVRPRDSQLAAHLTAAGRAS